MPVNHTNRKGVTYTLCRGTTKTGKPRYYFVRDPEDREVVDEIPEGWEIRESVNGVVSLARERPQQIQSGELAAVRAALRRHPKGKNYRVDVKPDRIVIHQQVGPDADELISELSRAVPLDPGSKSELRGILEKQAQFTPVLRFILDDAEQRVFRAERWCYLGRIDDWIFVTTGPVDRLARKLIPTLGTDEFFELY